MFLTILNAWPFMLPHACRAIRDSYTFHGEHKDGSKFPHKYGKEINQFLDEKKDLLVPKYC